MLTVSGKYIIALQDFLFSLEVRVEHFGGVYLICAQPQRLIMFKAVGWSIAIARNTNQMYVWPQGKSTHIMIYSRDLSGSAAHFLQTVEACGFCVAAELLFCQTPCFFPHEEFLQASFMQRPFPVSFVSYLTLVILCDQQSCHVLPCVFIILCFSSTNLLLLFSLYPLTFFLLPFFLGVSFNFMPPALAVGPLASTRLALWHTAYQHPWVWWGWEGGYQTPLHRQTHT